MAEVLYQTAYIERFGTGTAEIIRLTHEAGLKKPEFDTSEGFKIIIWRHAYNQLDTAHDTAHDAAHDTAHDGAHDVQHDATTNNIFVNLSELTHRLIWIMDNEMSREELMEKLDLKHRQNFTITYLEPSLKSGLIAMTIPDKPTSKLQKYKLTNKGLKLQKKIKNEY